MLLSKASIRMPKTLRPKRLKVVWIAWKKWLNKSFPSVYTFPGRSSVFSYFIISNFLLEENVNVMKTVIKGLDALKEVVLKLFICP